MWQCEDSRWFTILLYWIQEFCTCAHITYLYPSFSSCTNWLQNCLWYRELRKGMYFLSLKNMLFLVRVRMRNERTLGFQEIACCYRWCTWIYLFWEYWSARWNCCWEGTDSWYARYSCTFLDWREVALLIPRFLEWYFHSRGGISNAQKGLHSEADIFADMNAYWNSRSLWTSWIPDQKYPCYPLRPDFHWHEYVCFILDIVLFSCTN